jgi:hypothetical protein
MAGARHAIALGAALLLGCGGAGSVWQPPPTSDEPRAHVDVHVTDGSVTPATARLLPDGTIVWLNYAMDRRASVFLPEEMRGSMRCDTVPPSFMKTGRGYRSVPFGQGADTVSLPCPLDPGEYRYQVWLYDTSGAGLAIPTSTLSGTIVVEGAP